MVGGEDLPGLGLVGESTSGLLISTRRLSFEIGSRETAGVMNSVFVVVWAASAIMSSIGSVTSRRPDLAEDPRASAPRFDIADAIDAGRVGYRRCATMQLR